MNEMDKERERCKLRRIELGNDEITRRTDYYNKAQALCAALVGSFDRGNPELEAIIDSAEDLRERIVDYTWGRPVASPPVEGDAARGDDNP
jgi:hypothetical protein